MHNTRPTRMLLLVARATIHPSFVRVVPAIAVALAFTSIARAQEREAANGVDPRKVEPEDTRPLRAKPRAPRFELVTTLSLPTVQSVSTYYDTKKAMDELEKTLGVDKRTFWLMPNVALSLVDASSIATLKVIGWGQLAMTPMGFGGGVLTWTEPLPF